MAARNPPANSGNPTNIRGYADFARLHVLRRARRYLRTAFIAGPSLGITPNAPPRSPAKTKILGGVSTSEGDHPPCLVFD